MLVRVLRAVTEEFAAGDRGATPEPEAPMTLTLSAGPETAEREPVPPTGA